MVFASLVATYIDYKFSGPIIYLFIYLFIHSFTVEVRKNVNSVYVHHLSNIPHACQYETGLQSPWGSRILLS